MQYSRCREEGRSFSGRYRAFPLASIPSCALSSTLFPTRREVSGALRYFSSGMAVCAVCSHPVGIDIQVRKPCSKGLVRRICSPEEYRWICEKKEKEAEKTALRLWTLKESYAKADGRGLAFPFRQISFANRLEREPECIFYGTASFELPLDLGDRHGFTADIPGWRFFEAQLGDAYHIGVCMRDTDPDKKGAAG